MHVAIIADSIDNQNAGIHVYTKNMIESLGQSANIKVTCFRLNDEPRLKNVDQVVVPTVFSIGGKDPIRLFFTLPWAIRKAKPDVVIEPTHFGPFNLPKKIKRVTVIHDLTPIKFPQWHVYFSQVLQRIFLPSILKRDTLIITNSSNTRKDVNEIYPFTIGKTAMIYPGVDKFYHNPETEIKFEKQPFFLFTGTIEPRKNLSLLLNAYQLFRENTIEIHKLVLCGGKGWKNEDFFSTLENHPFKSDIEVKGFVTKEALKDFYSKATAFIYPSLYEGFGFPIAEAMGCGAPCIVARNSSLTEVGGDAVEYFDPQDANELAEKMRVVVQSKEKQKQMIERGKQQAEKFSWEEFAKSLETELLKLKT
jgi:glycosyltransferase involved in cell wall biosynthesis